MSRTIPSACDLPGVGGLGGCGIGPPGILIAPGCIGIIPGWGPGGLGLSWPGTLGR